MEALEPEPSVVQGLLPGASVAVTLAADSVAVTPFVAAPSLPQLQVLSMESPSLPRSSDSAAVTSSRKRDRKSKSPTKLSPTHVAVAFTGQVVLPGGAAAAAAAPTLPPHDGDVDVEPPNKRRTVAAADDGDGGAASRGAVAATTTGGLNLAAAPPRRPDGCVVFMGRGTGPADSDDDAMTDDEAVSAADVRAVTSVRCNGVVVCQLSRRELSSALATLGAPSHGSKTALQRRLVEAVTRMDSGAAPGQPLGDRVSGSVHGVVVPPGERIPAGALVGVASAVSPKLAATADSVGNGEPLASWSAYEQAAASLATVVPAHPNGHQPDGGTAAASTGASSGSHPAPAPAPSSSSPSSWMAPVEPQLPFQNGVTPVDVIRLFGHHHVKSKPSPTHGGNGPTPAPDAIIRPVARRSGVFPLRAGPAGASKTPVKVPNSAFSVMPAQSHTARTGGALTLHGTAASTSARVFGTPFGRSAAHGGGVPGTLGRLGGGGGAGLSASGPGLSAGPSSALASSFGGAGAAGGMGSFLTPYTPRQGGHVGGGAMPAPLYFGLSTGPTSALSPGKLKTALTAALTAPGGITAPVGAGAAGGAPTPGPHVSRAGVPAATPFASAPSSVAVGVETPRQPARGSSSAAAAAATTTGGGVSSGAAAATAAGAPSGGTRSARPSAFLTAGATSAPAAVATVTAGTGAVATPQQPQQHHHHHGVQVGFGRSLVGTAAPGSVSRDWLKSTPRIPVGNAVTSDAVRSVAAGVSAAATAGGGGATNTAPRTPSQPQGRLQLLDGTPASSLASLPLSLLAGTPGVKPMQVLVPRGDTQPQAQAQAPQLQPQRSPSAPGSASKAAVARLILSTLTSPDEPMPRQLPRVKTPGQGGHVPSSLAGGAVPPVPFSLSGVGNTPAAAAPAPRAAAAAAAAPSTAPGRRPTTGGRRSPAPRTYRCSRPASCQRRHRRPAPAARPGKVTRISGTAGSCFP